MRRDFDRQANITPVAATVQDDQGPLPSPKEAFYDDLDINVEPRKTSSTPTIPSRPSLRDLLAACRPPLLQILPAMIDIGFKSEEDLEAVLAWPVHRLVGALEKWHTVGYLPINVLQREALINQFLERRSGCGKQQA